MVLSQDGWHDDSDEESWWEDAEAADRVFSELMGEDVAPRKAFIQDYATSVRNLDV